MYYSIMKFGRVVLLFARNEQWGNAYSHIENILSMRFLVWGKLVHDIRERNSVINSVGSVCKTWIIKIIM